MNKKYKTLTGVVALVGAIAAAFPSAVNSKTSYYKVNANEVSTVYNQAFNLGDSSAILNSLKVVKDDENTVVGVVDAGDGNGALQVKNASGVTEITLPVNAKDFVLEFDCKRTDETNVRDTAVGFKYRESADDSYEIRIHSAQKDLSHDQSGEEGGTGDFSFAHYTGIYMDESTGHGIENWYLSDEVSSAGVDNGRIETFNYYYHEFYVGEWYNFRFQVTGDYVELFVNGERFLKDVLERDGGDGITFRVDSEKTDCTAIFDNIRVYEPKAYAEKLIGELPEVKEGQSQEVVGGYLAAIDNVKAYIAVYVGEDCGGIANYATLTEKEESIERGYGVKTSQKPTLNVAWINDEYKSENDIKLPEAKAVSVNGEPLAVEIKVLFGGKRVKCENGVFTANEVGEYEIVYVARDVKGNETSESHRINVTAAEKPADEVIEIEKVKDINPLTFGISVGVLAAGLAVCVALCLLGRKKR